jgi:hypothetical protein
MEADRHAALVPAAIDLLIAMSPFGMGPWARKTGAAVKELARAAERGGDVRALGRAWFLAGNSALAAGRLDEAERYGRRALELYGRGGEGGGSGVASGLVAERVPDRVIVRQVLNDLGVIAHARGDYEEAARLFGDAVELARELGHRTGEMASLLNMAVSRLRAGRAEEVLADCDAMLGVGGGLGTGEGLGVGIDAGADAGVDAAVAGVGAKARGPASFGAGDSGSAAQALYVSGLALLALGRESEAAERFDAAAVNWSAQGVVDRAARARFQQAKALHAVGAGGQAREYAMAALVGFEAEGRTADQRAVRLLLDDLEERYGELRQQ